MIDFIPRKPGRASDCEICKGKPATKRAHFTAHFLQEDPSPLLVEEHVAKLEFEKRVCDGCAEDLQNMKNVTNLTLESL
jgi:hypothetical protein